MLPDAVVAGLGRRVLVVEVGVGGRFETASDLRRRRPDVDVLATDVVPARLAGAPPGVRTARDDVVRPTKALYAGARLVYAVRPGEEIQPALAALAAGLGAILAVAPLGDEVVDAVPGLGRARRLAGPDGRVWFVWGRG